MLNRRVLPLALPRGGARSSATRLGLQGRSRIWGPYLRLGGPRRRSPDTWGWRTSEGRPLWGRKELQGAYLSPVPSTLRSVRRKGTETHVTPEGVYKTDSSDPAWRCAVTGVRATVSNTRGQPREAGSLSRLFGSVDTTAKCVSMGPADCRKGVSNSVRFSTTAFQRRDSHTGGPRAGSGYGTRSESPIKEGGHRGGPSSREGIRVLQPVFHSSQEGWRVASDHRSASTEPLSQSAEVQDAHAKASCVTNQVRGLVCHDRSKRRILPRFHPSVSQEVPKVRFWGQSIPISGSSLRSSTLTPHVYKSSGCSTSSVEAAGHPHTKLYRRLADSSSVGDGGGETSRCRPRSYGTVGVETKRQEKCAFSGSEDHLFRRGVGFDHDAGTNVSCSDRVDFHVSQESERRPVTHCQAVSEIAGSDGSCVQRDTIWPAVHEIPAVVAQNQGIFPEGKSTSHDQGLSTVCASPRHVEETLVLKSGPGAGSSVSPVIVSDGRVSHRLGSSHEWPLSPRPVEWSPSHMAHQLSGDVSGLSSTEIFPPRPERSPCVGAHRQHSGGLLHQPPGGSALAPVVQTGTPDPLVVPGQVPLTESTVYSWVPECGTRRTVETGAEARGMDASHPEVVKQIWRIFYQAEVDLFATRVNAQCPLWFSLAPPAPLGLDAMVQTWPRLRLYAFPPIALLPGVLTRVRRDGVRLLLVAPYWPGRVWFSDLISLLDDSPWEVPVRRDLLSQAGGAILHPRPELWKLWVWPLRGTAHSFWSPSWGGRDHSPIQSSLYEESVQPEVEVFHFMVQSSPAGPC